jgi:alkylation response protein AidB-like acyl-CoA dehydrogenase
VLPDPHAPARRRRAAAGQITGSSEFCEVFATNARVEKSDQIGKLGEGWAIANTTPGYERGRSLARVTTRRKPPPVAAAKKLRCHGKPLAESPVVRQKLGRIWPTSGRALQRCGLTQLERGEHPAPAAR